MTNVLLTPPLIQFFGSDGTTPNALGKVYFYQAGTSTPKNTYDQDGATNANPVILDPAGRADIWINGSYKVVVKTADDVTISTTDNLVPFTASSTLDGLSDVLYDITTDNNLIIGRNTALTTGAKFNVFIGEAAGSTASTTATDNNTAVGYHALQDLAAGNANTAVGSLAGKDISSGTNNTVVGYNALSTLTTGSSCTAIGDTCLTNNLSGGANTGVGYGALFSTTGANNTALGTTAGFTGTANTTGTSNTYIGYSAQTNGAAYTNSTAIGANAIVTASNTMQLGDSGVTTVTCGTSNTASIKALNTAKVYGCVAVSGATPTLEESFNVTSIGDTGTGQLTVTIATDFANAIYTVVTGAELTATSYAVANDRKVYVRFGTQAAGTFDLDCIDSTAVTNVVKDPETWYFAAFGKQ